MLAGVKPKGKVSGLQLVALCSVEGGGCLKPSFAGPSALKKKALRHSRAGPYTQKHEMMVKSKAFKAPCVLLRHTSGTRNSDAAEGFGYL